LIFVNSRLVHSSNLEEILKRERSYAKVIAEMIHTMDREVENLSTTQQEEMDAHINQLDITTTSEVRNAIKNIYVFFKLIDDSFV